jgi:hypothetical protein
LKGPPRLLGDPRPGRRFSRGETPAEVEIQMQFWKTVSGPILLVGLASPALMNCDALGGMLPSCKALETKDLAQLKLQGDAGVQGTVKGFLGAVIGLDDFVVELETGLIASCAEIGKGLKMSEAELTAEPKGGDGAKKVCDAVIAKIDGILKASGNAELELQFDPPRCDADIEALEACWAGCDAAFKPGSAEVNCEGGEISGSCEGKCEGTCNIEAGAECGGKCEGTCNGKCDGKDSSGKCEGKCDGSCSATCKVQAQGECKGSCSGKCDVKMKAPQCSGEVKPPQIDVSCQTSCAVKTASSVKCHPPGLSIVGKGGAKIEGDLKMLVDTLVVSLPKVLSIQLGIAKKFPAKIEAVVQMGSDLTGKASALGLEGAACVGAGVKMLVDANVSFKANIEVSASVSGSASGSGKAGG